MVLVCLDEGKIANDEHYCLEVIYQLKLADLLVQDCNQLFPFLPELIERVLLLEYA